MTKRHATLPLHAIAACSRRWQPWLLLVPVLLGTPVAAAPEPTAAPDLPVPSSNAVVPGSVPGQLQQWFDGIQGLALERGELAQAPHLARFYQQRDYVPAWSNNAGLVPAAHELIRSIGQAELDGLRPEDYHLADIQARERASPAGPSTTAELDLLLSDAFMNLATHLHRGRITPASSDPDWFIEPAQLDPVPALESVLHGQPLGEALRTLAPQHPGYWALRDALKSYRALAEAGGWPTVPGGEKLQRGDRDARVAALRQRLAASGELSDPAASDVERFDGNLDQAVRRFQERHGLDVDGVVGRKTLAALNVSADERVQQILLNLERWRWLPHDLGSRYIMVNMAGFELALVEEGQPTLEMRVIVGKTYRSTPAFVGKLTYLVLNPPWNIPPKLARLDILPKVSDGPDYLKEKGIRVLSGWGADAHEIPVDDIQWSEVSAQHFPYKLQQRPGPENALGRIKFMLPNRFDVYLHDTPSRQLFRKSVRTFSSGCIRLEKPVELAQHLLNGNRDWNEARLQEAIDSGKTRTLSLPAPIRVYLTYFTAWVDQDGVAQFRDDIYQRDARLEMALFGPHAG